MRAWILIGAAIAALAGASSAQVVRVPGARAPAPVLVGIDALRLDFVAQSGSDTVYFAGDGHVLGQPARATLDAQARWLRLHPEVIVRIEGHADPGDTRDHALAIGARRAAEVRDYLILLGVPAAQLTATTWGKERPGPPRTVSVLVR